jgi:hypothetical protein
MNDWKQGKHEHVYIKLDLTALIAALVVFDWEVRKKNRAQAEQLFLPKPPSQYEDFEDSSDEEN